MRRDVLIPYRLWFVFPVPAAYFGESRMLKLGWQDWLHNQRYPSHLLANDVAALERPTCCVLKRAHSQSALQFP